MADALMFGHRAIQEICKLQNELVAKAGKKPVTFTPAPQNPWLATVKSEWAEKIRNARQSPKKQDRSAATKAVKEDLVAKYYPNGLTVLEDGRTVEQLKSAFADVDHHVCRELTLEGKDIPGIAQLTGRINTMTVARVGTSLSREQREKVESDVTGQAIAQYRTKAAEVARQFGFSGYTLREVQVNSNEPPMYAAAPMMRAKTMSDASDGRQANECTW